MLGTEVKGLYHVYMSPVRAIKSGIWDTHFTWGRQKKHWDFWENIVEKGQSEVWEEDGSRPL